MPPDMILLNINSDLLLWDSLTFNNLDAYSLKEKFNACVGKYLITLAQFPLHKDINPSSFMHRLKQSTIPLYLLVIFLFSASVYKINFTLSIGAATVLDIAPATPPEMKLSQNILLELLFDYYTDIKNDCSFDKIKN